MRRFVPIWTPKTTRWLIVENGDHAGSFGCPDGRRFVPGDRVNLPTHGVTQRHRGTVWRVAAVEEVEGWDGRLVLDSPRVLPDA